MSIRRPMIIESSWLFWPSPQLSVCTKTTDQMGWRGQLKRIKYEIRLGEPNRSMSMGPKENRAHSLCEVPDKTKAQTCLPRLRFLKTCSARRGLGLQGQDLSHKEKTCPTRIRLALQGKDLGYKERRQDLTTIKAPTSSSHQGTHNWPISSTLEL